MKNRDELRFLRLMKGCRPLYRLLQKDRLKPYQMRILYGAFLLEYNPHFRMFGWLPLMKQSYTRSKVGVLSKELAERTRKSLNENADADTWESEILKLKDEEKQRKRFLNREEEFDRWFREYEVQLTLSQIESLCTPFSSDITMEGVANEVQSLCNDICVWIKKGHPVYLETVDAEVEKIKSGTKIIGTVVRGPNMSRNRSWLGRMLLIKWSRGSEVDQQQLEDLATLIRRVVESEDTDDLTREFLCTQFGEKERSEAEIERYDFSYLKLRNQINEALYDVKDLDSILRFLLEDHLIESGLLYMMYVLCRKIRNTPGRPSEELLKILNDSLTKTTLYEGSSCYTVSKYKNDLKRRYMIGS